MKTQRRLFFLLLPLVFLLAALTGCNRAHTPSETEGPGLFASGTPESNVQTRKITDMAGRTVEVPNEISSAFSATPASAIYLYTLVPDKMLGWNYELNEAEKSMIPEEYHTLPSFGMGDAISYEAVIAAGPDIAVSAVSISRAAVEEADKLSQRLGIPVVVLSADLMDTPAAYRLMGELFGVAAQAEKLAAYAEETFGSISSMDITDAEKVRVYYGNGETSLETAPAGSSHGQIIELVNAVNAARLELGDGSRMQISKEQLLAWDPDVIIVNGEPKASLSGGAAADALLNDPDLNALKAVKNGMVFGIPNAPFGWVDRPPGPNRIIGMRWLAGKIYPEHFDFDVDEEVRTFFRLFYHVNLTDEQLAQLYEYT